MGAAGIGTQAKWLQTQVLNNHSTLPPEKSLVEKVEERGREARPPKVQANTLQASIPLCYGREALLAHTTVTGGSLLYNRPSPHHQALSDCRTFSH